MKTPVNNLRSRGSLAPAVTAALLLVAAGAATAATRPVNEQGRMPADGQVTIENIAGSVKVVAWDQAEIRVTGTLGEDVKELEFSAGARSVVRVVYPERRGLHFNGLRHKDKGKDNDAQDGPSIRDDAGADLTISVPRGCRLEVEVVSADVDVTGITNEVSVTAVSGKVGVRGACSRLEVESVSGDVEVDGAGRQTEVTTVSGNLQVRCDDADLQVETVTGDAKVDCASLRSLEAATVNGTITMSGRPAAGAQIEAESVNGNLTLVVPGDVSAAFEVSTFNGGIENAFGQKAERTDKHVPGQELTFTNGKGEADVSLNTLNGKIVILKK